MRFDPKDAEQVIPAGHYEAFVQSCEEKTSKNGNEMFEVRWKVYADEGRELIISDYIVSPKMIWKLKKLCRLWGLMENFEAGSVSPEDILGNSAMVEVKVDPPKGGYDEKNSIKGYAPLPDGTTPKRSAEPAKTSDDVPF